MGRQTLSLNVGREALRGHRCRAQVLNESFPAGLTVSQRIQDKEKRDLGVVTLYGPQMENGQIKVLGGLFIASDLNTLFRLRGQVMSPSKKPGVQVLSARRVELSPYDGFEVAGSHADRYRSHSKLLRLLRKFQRGAIEAGLTSD